MNNDRVLTVDRVLSVDALRGLTILLMVFVNDLGRAAPAWMHHIRPSNADGMTLADIVFPTFLFIAGVSIPLAVASARAKGASNWHILGHIITRTLALLAMGLIELNEGDDQSLPGSLWGLLSFVSLIAAACYVPPERGRRRTVLILLKIAGIAGLIALLAIYRREPVSTDIPFYGQVESWKWLRTEWGGILGLIGWAYLGASLVYLAVGQRREWLMAAIAVFLLFHLSSHADGLLARVDDKPWLAGAKPAIETVAGWYDAADDIFNFDVMFGTLGSVTMAGCVLGAILKPDSDVVGHAARLKWGLGFAGILLLYGLLTDCFEGINKIAATPAWCMLCAALACATWVLLYLLMDVWQYRRWSIVVRPAGANPLIAYLLHPILIWVAALTGVDGVLLGYHESPHAWAAIFGSIAMALTVCGLTGLIARLGLRMRV